MMKMRTAFVVCVLALITTLNVFGCASSRRFVPPPQVPDDRAHIPVCPKEIEAHIMWDGFKRQMIQPGADLLDFSRWLRKATGNSKEAYNLNAFDEIENSSWFTNRNVVSPLSLNSIAKGPNTVDGPDQSNGWTIVRAKTLGITPGFNIKDSRGDTYVIKLDPPGFNGLNSGAEVVTTKLLYAAGYNVPENFAVTFDPSILSIGENVKFTGADGANRTMTEQDLADILSKVELTPDGKIRAIASKYISGRPIGPFYFKGTRADDPNDFIPHEHRRELRGLRVIFAWLGHYDTNSSNFLDGYVEESGVNYVRHYLIDFGAAMGSHPAGAKPADRGSEPYMDPVHLLNKSLELGMVCRPRDYQSPVLSPLIGRFTSDNFHPKSFKFIFPTRAFEYYTPRDAYWGAKIVASFTEPQIRAAVQAAIYADQDVEDYLVRTLMERRDIVCRYWFSRVAPLDHFKVTDDEITFGDLAVSAGLDSETASSYRYRTFLNGRKVDDWQELGSTRQITKSTLPRLKDTNAQLAIECQVRRSCGWSHSVVVYLEKRNESLAIVGIERDA